MFHSIRKKLHNRKIDFSAIEMVARFYLTDNYGASEDLRSIRRTKKKNVEFYKKCEDRKFTEPVDAIDARFSRELFPEPDSSTAGVEVEKPPVQYSLKTNELDDLYEQFQRRKDSIDFMSIVEQATEKTFVDMLLCHIGRKHLRDSQVYRAAHIDRRLFSKIVSNRNYTPQKDTCLALCFALQLDLTQTKDMLERAGYSLTHSKKRDVIIEFLIRERIFNLFEANEVLDRLCLEPLRANQVINKYPCEQN